ncbi:MAG TPA: site-2 protease family protein [Candidatus Thiothrix moscowensis]|uniref:site-2 protease family protein n=1 Tax=unclassified Thiothrix TaxID=2636184 RepID=UPI001A1F0AF4|nr:MULTISPECIES: site-2 protease family protein [unclassified Thiothrix]MBJ6609077.1 site-2 protease family protein [Candidatus Thiothrix moscowensis]HRJ52192.1 site-2 protease family protein [Candidatus Thiothrix moscowensis]HRJ92297.1 site-2 protease family protein [Candidatus Thiothrix moscowensis]
MDEIDIGYLIRLIAAGAIPVLFAITLHEVAHGWVAHKLGDSTAKMLGRLTVNPLRHIDPVGTVALPLGMLVFSMLTIGQPFAFGWAKPIPVNTRNLRQPRRDMAIVAIAGPLANFLMAVFWVLMLAVFAYAIPDENIGDGFITMARIGLVFNLVLLVLNLLPIPPLDGGRVLAGLVPRSVADLLDRIEPYGFPILIGLMLLGVLDRVMWPVIDVLYSLLIDIIV